MKNRPILDRLLTIGLISLALVFLIEFTIWCLSPVSTDFEQQGDIISLLPKDATTMNATITSDGYYNPSNSDPQLIFNIKEQKIASVVLYLGEKLNYSGNVQLFFAGPEHPLSEENSVAMNVYRGTSSVDFSIPEGQYNLLRLDINTPVILDSVKISNGGIVNTTHCYILKFPKIALETLALSIILLLLLRLKKINLFFNSLNKKHIQIYSILVFLFSYFLYRGVREATGVGISIKCFVLLAHLIVLVLLALMMRSLNNNKISLEKLFVIIALPLSIVYMFIITPLAVPDETHHYHSAYELSNYMMFKFNDIDYGKAQDFDYHGLEIHYNTLSGYERLVSELFHPGEESEKIPIPGPKGLSYPLMYLPQALGIAIGRLFGANFLILFYLGRLFNILFYCLCAYLAIKLVPKQKPLFFALSLMPMALHQAASYSYDTFINGMILLYIALIIRATVSESKMGTKEYLALLNMGMLIAPAKVIYIFILLLALLIPGKRFANKKQHIISILGFWGAAAVFELVWWLPAFMQENTLTTLSGGEVYSVSFLLRAPLMAIDTIVGTLKEGLVNWTSEAIGYHFAGLSLWLPHYISIIYLFLLFVLSIRPTDEKIECVSTYQRIVYLSIAVICTLLTLVIMFVTWTYTSSKVITGVQGRYFIPLLPLLFLALENNSIIRKRTLDMPLLFSALLLNIITVDNILEYTLFH